MTDLLTRPGRTSGAPGPDRSRSLTTGAILGGAVAALAPLVVCCAVAITGWFLADAGSHGDTTDALRVGADVWLVGNGSGITVAGAPLTVVPLGLLGLLALAVFRAGAWAARGVRPGSDLPHDDPRAARDGGRGWALATGMFAASYLVVLVVVWVLASGDADLGLGRAMLVGLLLAGVAGGLGIGAASGDLARTWARVPAWLRQVAYGTAVTALLAVAGSALALAVALAVRINEAATVLSGLHLGVGDAVSYTVVVALLVPNCVLLTTSYLLGPGFAVGTGTVVSPTFVTLGPVPAFPVLAALPPEGHPPGWLAGVAALPALAAAIGAGRAQARSTARAYDLAAIRGACVGVAAALVLTVGTALAGGSLGTGRMADIGAPFFEVLVIACGALGVGGMLGGVLVVWRQRRTAPVEDDEAAG